MLHVRFRHYIMLMIVLSICIGTVVGFSGGVLSTIVSPDNPKDYVIIIDPGHGGIDGGAVGVNGTTEKDINLAISLKLRDILTGAGYTVVMTRDTDISIHDEDAQTVRQKKVSDLRKRLAMTKLYEKSILISVHQNALGAHRVTGAQVFYSPNNPESKVFAEALQTEFNANLQRDGKDKTVTKAGKNLYLFYNAQNIAVLCECGFLSNADEERTLNTPEYQERVAFAIFSGLVKYLDAKTTVLESVSDGSPADNSVI